MTELAACMKSSKRAESTMSDEDIDLLCTDSEEVLSLFDDFLRILRKGTEQNHVEAEQARDKAMEKCWGLDFFCYGKIAPSRTACNFPHVQIPRRTRSFS